jgi:hypothetical protein
MKSIVNFDFMGTAISMKKQADYVKTALRVPRDLHTQLHQAADASERSFNAEIVARLEASFAEKGKVESVPAFMESQSLPLSPLSPLGEGVIRQLILELEGVVGKVARSA